MSATSVSRPDFRLGDWLVRPSLATIERGAEAVHVTPRSMAVLIHLADARGEVVSRNEILDAVWPGMSVTPDALSQCVVELRKAFRDDPKHPAVIQTIPKLGLRLLTPVTPIAAVEVEPQPQHQPSATAAAGIFFVTGRAHHGPHRRSDRQRCPALERQEPQRGWQDPLVGADFTSVTDFIGSEEHAAISHGRPFRRFRFRPRWSVGCLCRPDRHRRLPEPDARTDCRVAQPCRANAQLLPHRIRGDDLVVQRTGAGASPSLAATCAPGPQALQRSTGLATASASSTTPRRPATRYSSPVPMRSLAANRSTRRRRASIATSRSGRVTARRSTSCGASCRTKWISGRFPPAAASRSA